MRKKYSNKTPRMRFFHKYTGIIVLSIILTIIFVSWGYMELNKVFFENWSCDQILQMNGEELPVYELPRYHEILLECQGKQFTP